MQRNTRLQRKTPIRRLSNKRAKELRLYSILRKRYLLEHPICEVWLRENGWRLVNPEQGIYEKQDLATVFRDHLIEIHHAPLATEIHHVNKRRGPQLNIQADWLAVCRANHERIEANKAWARREGFLRNF